MKNDNNIWFNQNDIAKLFNVSRVTVTEHILKILNNKELNINEVCRDFRHTRPHNTAYTKTQNRVIKEYNLKMIITLSYKIKTKQSLNFRLEHQSFTL